MRLLRRSSPLALFLVLALPLTAFAQTPTPAATAAATATPAPVATAEVTPTPEPEPTPEPMPTPEPIPEEGVNAGKPTSALVHGFVIVRYDNSDGKGLLRDAQNAYSVQNARIRIEGKAAPTVTYLAALEPLLLTGPLQEAFVGWNPERTFGPMKALRLRAGQMRKPIGYEGFTPEEALYTMEHSNVTRFLQGVSNYDVGVAAGTTLMNLLELDIGMFNGTGPFNAGAFPGPSLVGGQDPLEKKDVVGRAGVTLMENKIRTGLSIVSGQSQDPIYVASPSPGIPPIASVHFWRVALDAEANIGPALLISEVVYGNSTLDDPTPATPNGPTATGAAGYLFAGWRIPSLKLMPHLRYEYADPSIGDGDDIFLRPRDWSNAIAVGVNWDPVKHVRVRSQYEVVSGLASQPANGAYYNPAANAVYSEVTSGTASVSVQADF